jgi:protein-tyrosine phosphatase
MKILMVCLGNICRSTLAEGILAAKITEKGLDWQVDSAGTGNWHIDSLPDYRSIAVAKKYGIDISNQRARQLEYSDLDEFDLIFAMDTSNFSDIRKKAKKEKQIAKIHLIRNLVSPKENLSVPDPYFDDNGFEEVYFMLDEACDKILEKWAN